MAYNIKNMEPLELLDYYIINNINDICRLCLQRDNKLMPIFDPIKPPHFSILIMACSTVQVVEGDGLPSYICPKCIQKLNSAYQFKTQFERADAKLRECLGKLTEISDTTDLSNYIEIKKGETSIILQSDNQDGHETLQIQQTNTVETVHTVQFSAILQTNDQLEEIELQPLQKDQLEPGTSLQVLEKTQLTELKIDLDEQTPLKAEDINLMIDENAASTKTRRPPKDHQCDTCGKIFRTKPGLVHHIRIHTGERPYVCHLCDKRFMNGGHLHTHMRTHTGEKNHVCSACNKAFATAQQLTKHTIAIHTSERPYGCTYCPKRFASSSNLNTHIKIHTGEKNYHCDQCAKAFSTKGQLYQHMLVHTGEKAFLCEYCNKRFSQKAHLVRHLKMHKDS
ncbi:PREDICTED: zinc finger protein 613-like [Nicrophorus vespilloides]|uniref:Zinc finger protein 613-like n=1 Tax=Nicrophorus vespilloides TaxID=110193 RepID=A0ABM1M7K2_NICVS|nr:PREDICTED: zinc finger protein 613-like [Nicrophorus vespilloides]